MAHLKPIYVRIGALMPARYRETIRRILHFSGKRAVNEYELLGAVTVFSLLVAAGIGLIPFAFQIPFGPLYFTYAAGGVLLTHYLSYLVLYIGLEDYTKRIEKTLPDFLRLTAANIRAGMTPFQAMKLAARPEFGPLADEVAYVTIRGLGTESFSELLLNMNKHIKSDSLDRVLRLFSSTVKSGGHLAQILEDSAAYIEEKARLKKELTSATKSYSIFIMFSVVVIAPFLLSISTQFLTMVIDIQSVTKSADSFGGFGGAVSISVDFLRVCAIFFLFITGLFCSMLMAVINQEKIQYGLKYALVIVTLSMIGLWGAQQMIASLF